MVRQPGGTSPEAPASKSSLIIRLPPLELLLELEELLELDELDELDVDEVELEELDEDEELELDVDELLELDELVPPQADKSTNKELAKVIRAKCTKLYDAICYISQVGQESGVLMTVSCKKTGLD